MKSHFCPERVRNKTHVYVTMTVTCTSGISSPSVSPFRSSTSCIQNTSALAATISQTDATNYSCKCFVNPCRR
ncbi:MAG: hypothetical protein K2I93_07760, partial [Oscillospiraceae bacterium]|nr:hypothetical protein [Oscillospiraceae bacterium]